MLWKGTVLAWHEQIVRRVVREQGTLAGCCEDPGREYDDLMGRIRADFETFYLSPLGHHQWRCGRSYGTVSLPEGRFGSTDR